jgi:ABC-type multidrug transport system ATPase subunit
MTDGQVLEFTSVTKRFNEVTAVSDFSARIEPGAVTAFLGPNGAGKTTSLRMLLGQVRPTSGTATIGGVAYADLRQPLRVIGSVLEETVYRTRRTANRQLTIAAKANDIPLSRVAEVLSLVGLEEEGDSRIGGFSLGMRQRLSVAHALLGDPGALVFDEPANGLDPEGIRWMRLLMRRLADEGRTVLVSSHVLSEVEQVADHVLVLSKGRLVLSSGIETLADPSSAAVTVDAVDRAALTAALAASGFDIEVLRSGLTVRGTDASKVGAVAAEAGIALTTLVQRGPTLEDIFIQLTRGGRIEPRGGSADASTLGTDDVTDTTDDSPAADADRETDRDRDGQDATASAIAADVAAAVPGGPVTAAVVATGAGVASTPSDAASQEPDGPTGDESDDTDAARDAHETSSFAPPAESASDASTRADASSDEAEDGRAEDIQTEPAPAPSFDDILFGTGPAAASAETPQDLPDDSVEGESGGIEVFDDLGPADDADEDEAQAEDPRAAAVSSMLAAAARAYYEEEPRDYPLAEASAADVDAPDGSTADGTRTDDAGGDATSTDEQDDDRTSVIEVIDQASPSSHDETGVPSDASAHEQGDQGDHGHENHDGHPEHHEHDRS